MIKTKNTKGLTGSIDYIDTDEHKNLVKENEALKEKLDDLAGWMKYEFSEAASEETKLVLNSIVKELEGGQG